MPGEVHQQTDVLVSQATVPAMCYIYLKCCGAGLISTLHFTQFQLTLVGISDEKSNFRMPSVDVLNIHAYYCKKNFIISKLSNQ